jgi:hypothetical protein
MFTLAPKAHPGQAEALHPGKNIRIVSFLIIPWRTNPSQQKLVVEEYT